MSLNVTVSSFSVWGTRGSGEPLLLLGDHLLRVGRQVQPQWALPADQRLPHRQGVGLEHGQGPGGDVPGKVAHLCDQYTWCWLHVNGALVACDCCVVDDYDVSPDCIYYTLLMVDPWDHHVLVRIYPKCLELAFSLLAIRGRLLWLRKDVWLYRSIWENDSTSLLIYSLSKHCKHECMVSIFSFKSS